MKKFSNLIGRHFWPLFFLSVIFISLRLWQFNSPLADFHSWRQADTMAVARNFQKDGINLLKPRYDDLSNIQSGKYNPEGLRMVEFPLYNALTTVVSNLSKYPIHQSGRIVNIGFGLLGMWAIYYLLAKTLSQKSAIFAGLFFTLMPYSVFYSRSTLPDFSAMSLATISCAIFYYWYNNKHNCYCFLTASILMTAALLIKPTSIFYILPIIFLFVKKFRSRVFFRPESIFTALIIFLPLFLWRFYIKSFPEGIPASSWLFTSVNTGGQLLNIFFRPAFFRWIFLERITSIISGSVAIVFIISGFWHVYNKSKFLLLIILSNLLYLFVFQGGNVQHDYYQIMILPGLAIAFAIGADEFISRDDALTKIKNLLTVIIVMSLSFYFSFQLVKNHYQVSESLLNQAKIINHVVPSESKIATDTVGDTTLLYLSDRRGFPAITGSSSELLNLGISYISASSIDEIAKNDSDPRLKKLFTSAQFAIYQIQP